MNVHDFRVKAISGETKSLADYSGSLLLIVNTASECGLTPQYEGLQSLYEKYKDRGFEVLGFPCNQFGAQEPGTHEQIQAFCKSRFGVTFPLFEKVEVNGPNTHPLYQYLKSHHGTEHTASEDIQWNFTKFLVGANGDVITRYEPSVTPEDIAPDIERALSH